MIGQGLSERRSLSIVAMSASAYRYQKRPDRNVDLRVQIVDLAQRYTRYGVGMIYLKLRQEGEPVNHKGVERLYREERLQVRRRQRKCPWAIGNRCFDHRQPTRCGRWTSSLTALPMPAC